MTKYIFSIICLSVCFMAHAQPNLFIPTNNTSEVFYWAHIHEYGTHVYYLTDRKDTFGNSQIVRNFYLTAVNKHTHAFEKSILLVRDTAFNVFENHLPFAISHDIDRIGKRINIFITSDVDSSAYVASPDGWYPKRISFMQLDTNLNVVIPPKPVLYSEPGSRYSLLGAGIAYSEGSRIILTYNVRDAYTSSGRLMSLASKFLIMDDTGKVLQDLFVGWEPTGTDDIFPFHALSGKLCKDKNGFYVARATFYDSICHGETYTMFRFDNNLRLIDTFDSPSEMPDIPTVSGNNKNWFGSEAENNFFLPTGSFVRSSGGIFKDNIDKKDYRFNCIGKGGPQNGYRPEILYFAPKADTNDFDHSTSWSYYPSDYNNYDNHIYVFASTESGPGAYCLNGRPNLGQIVALDTNLVEKWVKYIRPQPGHCLITSEAASADGRNGVLVSGWEHDIANPQDQSKWRPFIYHIDSMTSVGIDNLKSPVIISDQFSLCPNPAVDQITIDNVLGTDYSYSIINSIGQTVVVGEGKGISTRVRVENLPAGMYLVRVKTNSGKSVSLKFLK